MTPLINLTPLIVINAIIIGLLIAIIVVQCVSLFKKKNINVPEIEKILKDIEKLMDERAFSKTETILQEIKKLLSESGTAKSSNAVFPGSSDNIKNNLEKILAILSQKKELEEKV